MDLLTVTGLSKAYETFHLNDINFTLPSGYIMGFIGRNGAGKSTTIKAMLDMVHRDAGQVSVLGQDYFSNQLKLKQIIGVTFGAVDYYEKSPLRRITSVVRRFYDTWDDAAYRGYLERFELDERQAVDKLSAGMRVKYGLTLALSHQARLLILDEPTSGLDPVSRDDLLDLFREVIEDGDRSILFSTQITSDLEKCADFITYIRRGEIVASCDKDDFIDSYRLVHGPTSALSDGLVETLIGSKTTDLGFTGLIDAGSAHLAAGCELSVPSIEDIMVYVERQPKGTKR
ncbi:MAG: ABC transporter ATP-binding protein [Propionibacteriaceae bacterium]|jgi:ABC-2 type transport system ATP-binding protein|nr:ABC transporter ATP-binding protein [Propionibacteriaceae bacterium]